MLVRVGQELAEFHQFVRILARDHLLKSMSCWCSRASRSKYWFYLNYILERKKSYILSCIYCLSVI